MLSGADPVRQVSVSRLKAACVSSWRANDLHRATCANTGLRGLIAADWAMLDQRPDTWRGEDLRCYVRFGLGKWFSIS